MALMANFLWTGLTSLSLLFHKCARLQGRIQHFYHTPDNQAKSTNE